MARVLINPSLVDWQGQEACLFLNPRWPEKDFSTLVRATKTLLSELSAENAFLILASSGTSQAAGESRVSLKFIRKKNFLAAARSFNSFFSITDKDILLRALPLFHVGGLALQARAFLSQAKLVDFPAEKWDVREFNQVLANEKITRVSLVPTQVFDLVTAGLRAPSSVDTVFVGGASLSSSLRTQAAELGWPILSSYGMTETSSMVASQKYSQRWQTDLEPHFFPLPEVEFKIESDHRVVVKAPGLLSYEMTVDLNLLDSKPLVKAFAEGSKFLTADFGQYDGNSFCYLGRAQDLIKISGELVSLAQLRNAWENLAQETSMSSCLLNFPHPRTENEIVLVSYKEKRDPRLQSFIEKYNERVLPFQRIRRWVEVEHWPRTDLGKILVNELRAEVLKGESQQKECK